MTTEGKLQTAEEAILSREPSYFGFKASLCLVALTVPFPLFINNVAVFLLILVWLFTVNKDWAFIKYPSLLLASFLPYYLWHVLGVSYSENVGKATQLVFETNAAYLIFPVILLSARNFIFPLRKILFAFVAGFLLVFSIIIAEILTLIMENKEPISNLISHYTRWNFINSSSFAYHAPHMGLHASFCFAIVVHYFNFSTFLKVILQISVLLILLLSIYLFGSKLPFILVLIALIYYVLHFTLRRFLKFNCINLAFGLLIILLVTLVYTGRSSIIDILEQTSSDQELYWGSLPNRALKFLHSGDQDRLDNWSAAICAIKEAPLFGVGPGDGLESLQKCRDVTSWNYLNQANAHNQFLDVTIRSGILGLLLFIAGFVVIFRKALTEANKLYFYFALIFIFSLFFENFMDRQKGIIFFTFFNTVFLFQQVQYAQTNKEKSGFQQP